MGRRRTQRPRATRVSLERLTAARGISNRSQATLTLVMGSRLIRSRAIRNSLSRAIRSSNRSRATRIRQLGISSLSRAIRNSNRSSLSKAIRNLNSQPRRRLVTSPRYLRDMLADRA